MIFFLNVKSGFERLYEWPGPGAVRLASSVFWRVLSSVRGTTIKCEIFNPGNHCGVFHGDMQLDMFASGY